MLGLLLGLTLWCPAVVGWGALARRLDGTPMDRDASRVALEDALAGYVALAIIAIALNFVVPIGRPVAAVTCALGWAWAARAYGIPGSLKGRTVWKGVLLLVVVSVVAAQPVHYMYDAPLYHLPYMKWMRETVLPTGLANLHSRFGFNSAWLALATIVADPFDPAPLAHAILLPGTVLVFGVVAIVRSWRVATREGSVAGRIGVVGALAIASINVYGSVNGPAQDFAAIGCWLVATALVARILEHREDRADRMRDLVLVVTLGITTKLSALPIALLLLMALVQPGVVASIGTRRLARMALVPALLVLLWTARSEALSGCVAYPAARSCSQGLSWSVGPAQAAEEASVTLAATRAPWPNAAELLATNRWFRPWLGLTFRDQDVQMPMALLVASLVAFTLGGGPRPRRELRAQFAVLALPGLLAIPYWFVLAPGARYVAAALWSLGAAGMATLGAPAWSASRARAAWLIALAVWAPYAARSARLLSRPLRNPGVVALATIPRPVIAEALPVRPQITATGDTIWVPRNPSEDRCGLAPRPCTPYVLPKLIVVRAPDGTLRGFARRR